MKARNMTCLVMPTYKTMERIVQNHTDLFEVHKEHTREHTVHLVKQFLSAPTVKPKMGLSWLTQFLKLFNCPANLALEGLNLADWYSLTHSFTLLVPLTDHQKKIE